MDPYATGASMSEEWYEKKIAVCAEMMKQNIDYLSSCVYVLGSTRITDQWTIDICKELGKALAGVKNLTLVTSGFKGAQDLVAKSFLGALIDQEGDDGEGVKSRLVHCIPVKGDETDSQGLCSKVSDGTLEPMSYGRTLFLGESIAEQKAVLSRLLNTAILIQGDSTTAREVDEFIWQDGIVIPILSTGGAAAGEFDISLKVFARPSHVDEKLWAAMKDRQLQPDEVAKAVATIVMETKRHIANTIAIGAGGQKKSKFKSKLRKSSKKRVTIGEKIDLERKTGSNATLNANVMVDSGYQSINQGPEKSIPIVEVNPTLTANHKQPSKWKRVQKIFSNGC